MATTISKRARRYAIQQIARWLSAGRLEIQATGLDNVPAHGPAILLARHYHHFFDGIALYQIVPRELHILVTLDWASNRCVRYVMERAIRSADWPLVLRPDAIKARPDGTRPQKQSVFRANDIARYQRRALRDAVRLLVNRELLLIFPEAYPNIDPNYTPKKDLEEYLPFHVGFAVIAGAAGKALRREIPIVPVGLSYREGSPWRVRVAIGSAQYASAYPSRQALVDALQRAVRQLSN